MYINKIYDLIGLKQIFLCIMDKMLSPYLVQGNRDKIQYNFNNVSNSVFVLSLKRKLASIFDKDPQKDMEHSRGSIAQSKKVSHY